MIATLFVLPFIGENGENSVFAQRDPHAAMHLQAGAADATPVTFMSRADISQYSIPAQPVLWGMDTAWDSEDNVVRGTNFIGTDVLAIGRVSFQPSDLVDSDGNLSDAQQEALQSRLNHIALSGVSNVIVNCDHEALNSTNYYGQPEEWYKVIKATVNYCQAQGFTVLTVSPFNEPDYTSWGEGTQDDFREIARLISEDSTMSGIRISAGNTLNCDQALSWYNYMLPYATEGNTHQLAGTFASYAYFWQKVRSDGNYATADEMHNVGEAFIGVHYGLQSGVWWGYDGAARGEYCRASFTGKEIGYAENRDAWTAATVYKRPDGRTDAFIGSSERQATTSSYDFVSTDRPVYFDGYGPVYSYTMTIPGGTAYQTGQTNAERLIQITQGEDVPLDNLLDTTWVIMNVNSGLCLGFYNGAQGDGINLSQTKFSSTYAATHQQWILQPVDSRIGGDYGYFYLHSKRDTTQLVDVKNWSTSEGGEMIGYSGSGGNNEQFFVEYAGQGNYYIRSRHSGLYMQVRAASTRQNAYVEQGKFTGEAHQQWRFMPVKAKLETTAPTTPQGLSAQLLSASVQLTWDANADTDIAGYNVLRAVATDDTDNADAWDVIGRMVTQTTFVDNSVCPATSYIYKIKAIDLSRNISDASTTVAVTTPAVDNTLTLVASYDFEQTTADATENMNDGVMSSTPAYLTTNAHHGEAAHSIAGPHYHALPPAVASSPTMSVAFWARIGQSSATWQRLIDFGNNTDQYLFFTPNSGSDMRLVLKDGGEEQILSASRPINGWHHIAFTLDSDSVKIYVDGSEVANSTEITIRPTDLMTSRCYVGRSHIIADPLYQGGVDDLRIYRGALTADQVTAIMNGDEPTGISTVTANERPKSDKVYDLSGRQVSQSNQHGGVFITNGRKIVK